MCRWIVKPFISVSSAIFASENPALTVKYIDGRKGQELLEAFLRKDKARHRTVSHAVLRLSATGRQLLGYATEDLIPLGPSMTTE